jgi:hypothetical protein
MTTTKTDAKASLNNLESTLEDYMVKKAPFQLPDNIKELIVSLSPWFTLIAIVITLPLVFVALGLSAILTPFAALGGVRAAAGAGTNFLSTIPLVVAMVFHALAIPGLFGRKKAGWNFVFYASLASLLSNVLDFNIVGGALSAIIGWYFLFQVRSYYK